MSWFLSLPRDGIQSLHPRKARIVTHQREFRDRDLNSIPHLQVLSLSPPVIGGENFMVWSDSERRSIPNDHFESLFLPTLYIGYRLLPNSLPIQDSN